MVVSPSFDLLTTYLLSHRCQVRETLFLTQWFQEHLHQSTTSDDEIRRPAAHAWQKPKTKRSSPVQSTGELCFPRLPLLAATLFFLYST